MSESIKKKINDLENEIRLHQKYYYIDNINAPCKGCILYNNKIIISSINGYIYIKYTCLIK